MFKLKSSSAIETMNIGKVFSKILEKKDVVVLEGSLGGGKTTFVKGLLSGLGYRRKVLSPSFTLVRQYNLNSLSVYHIDLYRLEFSDIFEVGIDDFLYEEDSITLIEWGDKMSMHLHKYIKIEFAFSSENIRQLKFSTKGYFKKRLNAIKEICKQ